MVRLVIEDNGHGILPENRRRVFMPRFTTKDRAHDKERGYGLHFAKIMLLLEGGDVEVDASMAGGTRMVVWLRGDRDAESTTN